MGQSLFLPAAVLIVGLLAATLLEREPSRFHEWNVTFSLERVLVARNAKLAL